MNHTFSTSGLLSICILVLGLSGCEDPMLLDWAASPDTIYINARVHTGVPPEGLAAPTAVAVRNGQIVHVGTTRGTLQDRW